MATHSYNFVRFFLFCIVLARAVVGWNSAHATFYGDMSGSETMQGACGYGNLFQQGYGLETAALSTALFNNGLSCGACYELECTDAPEWCKPGTIQITATNFCPPNDSLPSDAGGWCNPPRRHFDLSMPMFLKLAEYRAGIVPVRYRRIQCVKTGGMKFEMRGNPWWIATVVYNVAKNGEVRGVDIKGSQTDWIPMTRNWGQVWQTTVNLLGQSLSFRVADSQGNVVTSYNVAPEKWQFGQTFEGNNF